MKPFGKDDNNFDYLLNEEMLKFDPLQTAEDMTGKSYKEDEITSNLGMALAMLGNAQKQQILEEQNDTHYGCTYQRLLSVANDIGFEIVLQELFDAEPTMSEPLQETIYILWHPEKAIIVEFETYQAEKINSAKMYFAFKPKDQSKFWCNFSCGGHWYIPNRDQLDEAPKSEWVWIGNMDLREGFRHLMNKFKLYGEFVNPWPDEQLIHFNTYMDWKNDDGYPYVNAIAESDRRYNSLPEEVKASIKYDDRVRD